MTEQKHLPDLTGAVAGLSILLFLPVIFEFINRYLCIESMTLLLILFQFPVHLLILFLFFRIVPGLAEDPSVSNWRERIQFLRLGRTERFSIRDTASRFGTMFVILMLVTWAVHIIKVTFNLHLPPQPLVQIVLEGNSEVIVMVLISAVLLAPLAEELLFRGAIFRTLSIKLDREWAGLITSLCFAAMHWNTLQFLPLFAMGQLLQKAYNETDTILTPTLMHMTHNALSLVWLITSTWILKWL